MRLSRTSRILALLVLVIFLFPTQTYAANCQFVLGFKAFHDQLASTVGDCLVDEHHNPQNGDALQETSKGLLVWRKSDNFTAFTDGYRTWVIGPFGMQKRLNTELLPWEKTSAGCSLTDQNVTFGGFTRAADGSESSPFTVKNPCTGAIDVIVDVTAQTAKGGAPLLDAPTVDVIKLAGGQSATFVTRVPPGTQAPFYATRFQWFKDAEASSVCLNVGASACLKTDGWLMGSLNDLNQIALGQSLLRTAADHGITLIRAKTDAGVLGIYSPKRHQITIDTGLDSTSSWIRAAVIAHELQHASDDVLGSLGTSSLDCYLDEERAFTTEATAWSQLWQARLPPNVDSLHTELNGVTNTVFGDPIAFAQALVNSYHSECAG